MASEYIESAANEILSNKRVLLRHPGARSMNELYPSPSLASTQLAELVNARGRYRIAGNNLQLGGISNFVISTSSIIQNWAIHASIVLAANRTMLTGWLLQAVNQIEVTFSNSLMQSIQLSGLILREYLLSMCDSEEKRNRLLTQAGQCTLGAAGTFRASIPVGNLILSAMGASSQFPLDQSTLAGSIQVLVRWNNAGSFTTNVAANGAAIPTAFNSLEMTCDTSDLLTGAFSIRQALSMDPSLSYNIPSRYINSTRVPIANFDPAAGNENLVQLTSCPAGMLEAIVICLKPTSEHNSTASDAAANSAYFPIGGSVNLSTLRLTYGGTDLFRADSSEEIKSNMRSVFGGDTMRYKQIGHTFTPGGPGPLGADISQYDCGVIIIPLVYDGCRSYQGHLIENNPSYSGASLELRFTVNNQFEREEYKFNAPFKRTNQVVVGSGGAIAWTLEVGYVLSAILEISQGAVDLQL